MGRLFGKGKLNYARDGHFGGCDLVTTMVMNNLQQVL